MSRRVLVTCRQMQACIDEFLPEFDRHELEVVMPQVVQQPSEAELIAIIGDFDGMIAGDDPLSAAVLDKAERLRIISKWGIGIDGIDLAAARERGIQVTNTPGVFGDEVGDVALGYVVLLARQLHRIDAAVRRGVWFKPEGTTLAERTLGVIAFGSIGQAVATRAKAFGMEVLAYDVVDSAKAKAAEMGVEAVDKPALFERSDFVVACSPLTPETHHFVDAPALALMKPGSYLINVSRGPVVQEAAVVDALESGRLAGAALDVFEEEPLAADSPLRGFDQCIFGSHNASNTREGVLRASAKAVENLLRGLGLK
jgi:D-3-phosphoglycerate dehydrogenase